MPPTPIRQIKTAESSWASRHEASLNWLALGLLLAAWNASDHEAPVEDPTAIDGRRPEALRGYDYVSVRAATRAQVIVR